MLLTPLVCNVHSFNRSFYSSFRNFYIIKLILVEFGSLSGGTCRRLWLVVVELNCCSGCTDVRRFFLIVYQLLKDWFFFYSQMIKRNINNVRRMTSHPTLPYCKHGYFFSTLEALFRDDVTHVFNWNVSLSSAGDFLWDLVVTLLVFPDKGIQSWVVWAE